MLPIVCCLVASVAKAAVSASGISSGIAVPRRSNVAARARIEGRMQSGRRPQAQASTLSPCFSTTASNLSAMPLGRLVPASHFCTVDSLVFR